MRTRRCGWPEAIRCAERLVANDPLHEESYRLLMTGVDPVFQGGADFDLELIESRTIDGHTQELIYRPTVHV